jgi:branched-chain amino acid transport system substrate-binding protein
MTRISKRRLFTAILSAGALLMLPALPAQAQAQPSGDPIRVGLLYAFTGAGATGTANYMAGARLAQKEINDAGGLLGRRIELIQADHGFDPARAVSEARRLVQQEKVAVVFGPEASALAIAVGPIFAEAKIPYLTTTTFLGATPFSFSAVMSGASQSAAMLGFAADHLKAKTVGIFVDNGSVGKGLIEDARRIAPTKGLQIVSIQEHETRVTDLTPQVLAMRRANPDVIIHSGSLPPDGGVFVKSLNEVKWTPKVISTAFGLATVQVMNITGPDTFKHGQFWGLVLKAHTYCAKEKVGDRVYDRYLSRLKANEPSYDKLDHKASLYNYEPFIVWKTAVEATKTLDGQTLVTWIEQNGGKLRAPGTGQPLGLSPTNHYLQGPDSITFVQRPDLVRAEDKLVERQIGC